jgi:hypothetical protein
MLGSHKGTFLLFSRTGREFPITGRAIPRNRVGIAPYQAFVLIGVKRRGCWQEPGEWVREHQPTGALDQAPRSAEQLRSYNAKQACSRASLFGRHFRRLLSSIRRACPEIWRPSTLFLWQGSSGKGSLESAAAIHLRLAHWVRSRRLSSILDHACFAMKVSRPSG